MDIKLVWKDICNKIEGISNEDWSDIINRHELGIARDTLRKATTGFFGSYNMVKIMEKQGLSDSEIFSEIEMKIIELEKEKIKVQNQKREFKVLLKTSAKLDHLQDEIHKSVLRLEDLKPIDNFHIDFDILLEGKQKEASLILSDWHIGLEYYDKLNEFNLDIAKKRLSLLLKKVSEYCIKNQVCILHVELLGDLINGYLHLGNRISNEEDVISQTMICSEMLSDFLIELKKHVPTINVYSNIGNHGRTTANIKESIETENFERLVSWYLQSRLRNVNNLFIYDCTVDYIKYKLQDERIVIAVHGNLDKPTTISDNYIKMYKEIPSFIHLGHTHSYQESNEYGVNVVVNGSFSGTDSFAKKIRKHSNPMQTLIIYEDNNDICTYKINL